jgi:hypothetical protein
MISHRESLGWEPIINTGFDTGGRDFAEAATSGPGWWAAFRRDPAPAAKAEDDRMPSGDSPEVRD